jgi:hypothetical protein
MRPERDVARGRRASVHHRAHDDAMRNEKDIYQAVSRALAEVRKRVPTVVDFELELNTDMDGQEAAFITVVLLDREEGDYRLAEVRPIEDAIRQRIREEDPSRYPYVSFELQSEQVEAAE